MKVQMKFQKAILLVTLIVAALCFIFALSFSSGDLNSIIYYARLAVGTTNIKVDGAWVQGVQYLSDMGTSGWTVEQMAQYIECRNQAEAVFLTAQNFNEILVTMSIVFIVVVALAYVMNCASRRNYYITNYIAEGILFVASLAMSVLILVATFSVMVSYFGLDFTIANQMAEKVTSLKPLTQSLTTYIIGIILGLVVLAVCVLNVLNVLWKVKLMKGEKALLAQKEV